MVQHSAVVKYAKLLEQWCHRSASISKSYHSQVPVRLASGTVTPRKSTHGCLFVENNMQGTPHIHAAFASMCAYAHVVQSKRSNKHPQMCWFSTAQELTRVLVMLRRIFMEVSHRA